MTKRLQFVHSILFIVLYALFTPAFAGVTDADMFQHRGNGDNVAFFFQTPEAILTTVESEDGLRHQFEAGNAGNGGVPGGYSLPSWSRWIEIPEGSSPVLHYSYKSERISDNIDLEVFPDKNFDKQDFITGNFQELDDGREHIRNDSFSPAEYVSISDVVTIGTKRMVSVDVTPYRYNFV